MCRVELKEVLELYLTLMERKFLMCRVELKGAQMRSGETSGGQVPNVPCGVER